MRIVHIVGARPQFIKAAMIHNVWPDKKEEFILHTGQHYDHNLDTLIFDDMGLRQPDHNLQVGSNSHAKQIAQMLIGIEDYLLKIKPELVLVYGDTNSTLAGVLAANKLYIPVAHIESGLRSFNNEMPEEINRIITDSISDYLFCPTKTATDQAYYEHLSGEIFWVGDVMADAFYKFQKTITNRLEPIDKMKLASKDYSLLTLHRPVNVDDQQRLISIFKALAVLGDIFIFPMHPRTRKNIQKFRILMPKNIICISPVGYLDMLVLQKYAKCIVTDSGGLQKEAYLSRIPCITLREETEWIETVQNGWNTLCGANCKKIISTYSNLQIPESYTYIFGKGNASNKIVEVLRG